MQADDEWGPFDPVELEEPPPRRRTWRAILAVCVGLVVLAIVLLARPPADRVADNDSLLSTFERIAFGRTDDLRIWLGPLRIAIQGERASLYRDQAGDAAVLFTAITGLDAQLLLPGTESFNLLIDIVPEGDYGMVAARMGAGIGGADYLAEHTLCYTISTAAGAQTPRFQRATVVIPDRLAEREVRACIWHELLHAFGFQSHPQAFFYSALREARHLSKNDLVLLRTLYDPRLGRGGRAQIMANARAVLEEHAATARTATDVRAALARR